MKQYTVTGMSCAACSARVEKAVSEVPGVTSCCTHGHHEPKYVIKNGTL